MLLLKILTCLLPWQLKRFMLINIFGFKIDKTAKIGFAWVYPQFLNMEEYSKIDHFTVAINLDKIFLGKYSIIGRSNWITGFSSKGQSKHFSHQISDREAILKIGNHSAITKQHHIDCTNRVEIGNFTTIAGYQSQFLTHSINIYENYQDSNPILIGDYCFVGTNVTLLGGAVLPSFSVLGAKSLLNKKFTNQYCLYAGVPAINIKPITDTAKYFNREIGFVY